MEKKAAAITTEPVVCEIADDVPEEEVKEPPMKRARLEVEEPSGAAAAGGGDVMRGLEDEIA